jgi:hypothetical protein
MLGNGTEKDGYLRDLNWRPLRDGDLLSGSALPSTGQEYFGKAGEDASAYYWDVGSDELPK